MLITHIRLSYTNGGFKKNRRTKELKEDNQILTLIINFVFITKMWKRMKQNVDKAS